MIKRILAIFSAGSLPRGRVESFSDGVFAFVATLLAYRLAIPSVSGPNVGQQLYHAYIDLIPKFLSYVLAFVFVAIWWVNHHAFFHSLKRVDYGVVWLNSLFLMFLCTLPFPTGMLGDYPREPMAVMLFGVFSVACSSINAVMRWYSHRAELYSDQVRPRGRRFAIRRSLLSPILYLTAVGAVWINVWIAWAIYFLVPAIYFIPHRLETKTPAAEAMDAGEPPAAQP